MPTATATAPPIPYMNVTKLSVNFNGVCLTSEPDAEFRKLSVTEIDQK
jgi:hypothetical protein